MMKHLVWLAAISLPLATVAADKPAAKPTGATAAAAPASSADSRAAVRASKERGSAMGACQQKAANQNLAGVERKQFITSCLSAK